MLVCASNLTYRITHTVLLVAGAGTGEQLLSKVAANSVTPAKAQQAFELQLHQQDPTVFGPAAPQATEKQAIEAQQQAILLSHSDKTPGLQQLLQACTATKASSTSTTEQPASGASSAFDGPLLRLLRRVALWWYYRVMFDPLEQLLALSSSYELLFQLMTPHQQLSCMADILLVLACPALEQHT